MKKNRKPFFDTKVGNILRGLLTTTKVGKIVDQVVIGGLINATKKESEGSPSGHLPNKSKDTIRPILTVAFWILFVVDMFTEIPVLGKVLNALTESGLLIQN